MTVDERIQHLEFVVASHIEQAKKDYAENRQLWREMREETGAIWKATDRRFVELKEEQAERDRVYREEQKERDRIYKQEQKERDEVMDKRVGDMVSAIGELCRRLDAKAEGKK